MATFVENETDEKGNPKKISLKQDEIELGILKQLFYKVNYFRYNIYTFFNIVTSLEPYFLVL